MSIELPDGLAKLFSGLTGMQWPQADEDALRTAGDDYLAISKDMPELEQYISELVGMCQKNIDGQAGDAFAQTMSQLIDQGSGKGALSLAGDQAAELGKTAHDTANQVEYAKWMTIAQLVQLAAEIAWAIAWGPFTGGASLGEIVVDKLITQEILKKIFAWLIDKIAMHTFLSIVGGLGLDAIIQMVQIAEGHKKWSDWDTKSTLQALEFGALNGLIGGPLDLLGGAVGKFLKNTIGKSLGKNALDAAFRDLSNGLAKDGLKTLSSDALRAAENDLLKTIEKDGIRTVSNDAAKTVADDAAKAAERTAATEAERAAQEKAAREAERSAEAEAEKSAAAEAERTAEQTTAAEAEQAVEQTAEKAAIAEAEKTAASVSHVISEGLSRATKEGAAWLEKEAAQKFGRELGETIGRFSHEFGTHFMAAVEKIDEKALAKFEGEMGKVFQEHLGSQLGKEEAQQLGKDFGKVLALSGGGGAKGLSALEGGMRGVLRGSGMAGGAIDALVKSVPGLLDKVGGHTPLFKLGAALGDYLKSGVHNSLTEGFYNLTFGEDHTFSLTWETFVSGIGMGAVGGGLHLGADHLFGEKYRTWAKAYLEKENEGKSGDFYGPVHPLTLISLLGNLTGHAAPFPVPRPKAAQDRKAEAAGERSPAGSGRPKTVSTGDEKGRGSNSGNSPKGSGNSGSSENAPKAAPIKVTGGEETPAAEVASSSHSHHSSTEDPVGAPQKRSTVSPGGEQEHGQQEQTEEPPATEPKTVTAGGEVPAPARPRTTASESPAPTHRQPAPEPNPSERPTVPAPPKASEQPRTSTDVKPPEQSEQPPTPDQPQHPAPPTSSVGPGETVVSGGSRRPHRSDRSHQDDRSGRTDPPLHDGPVPPVPEVHGQQDQRERHEQQEQHEQQTPQPEPTRSYHYTPAPEYTKEVTQDGRAEFDERHEQWQQAQRDLQDRYDARLHDALRNPTPTREGGERPQAPADREAEARLRESFDGSLPRGVDQQFSAAVWQRAKDLMYEQLTARPEEREQVLADLAGLTRLAGVREAALQVAMRRFDRAVALWGTPSRRLGSGHEEEAPAGGTGADVAPDTLAKIREDMSGQFRAQAEKAVTELYAKPEDATEERNAGAAQRQLARMLTQLSHDLDLRADYENALGQAESLVNEATRSWRSRVDATDKELLASVAAPEKAELSAESLELIKDSLRDKLSADFAEIAGSTSSAAEAKSERGAAAARFARALAAHAAGLPHHFAVQAVREELIRRAVDATEKAASTWAEGGGRDRLIPELANAVEVTGRQIRQARGEVARTVARELDERLTVQLNLLRGEREAVVAESGEEVVGLDIRDKSATVVESDEVTIEPGAAGEDRASARADFADKLAQLTAPEHLYDQLNLQAARRAVAESAEKAADAAAERGGLSTESRERVQQDHVRRVTEAFEKMYRRPGDLSQGRVRQAVEAFEKLSRPSGDHGAPEAESSWNTEQARLNARLDSHVLFETEIMPALKDAAEGFEELAAEHSRSEAAKGAGHSATEAAIADLKREYGADFFDKYHELWGPGDLDTAGWREHESANEDTFEHVERPVEQQSEEHTEGHAEERAEQQSEEHTEERAERGSDQAEEQQLAKRPTSSAPWGTTEHSASIDELVSGGTHRQQERPARFPDLAYIAPDNPHMEEALHHFPADDEHFVIAMEVGPNGPLASVEEMVDDLYTAQTEGRWEYDVPVRLVACRLASDYPHYVHAVVDRMQEKYGLGMDAVAANGQALFVPARGGGAGDLVVAEHVGYDNHGRPVVSGGGHWEEFSSGLPESRVVGPGMPEGYRTVDHGEIDRPVPGTVAFGRRSAPVPRSKHGRREQRLAKFEGTLFDQRPEPELVGPEQARIDPVDPMESTDRGTGDLSADQSAGAVVTESQHDQVSVQGRDPVTEPQHDQAAEQLTTAPEITLAPPLVPPHIQAPERPADPEPPQRFADHHLAAYDVLRGLEHDETVLERVAERFSQALHGDGPAARTLAEYLFGSDTLQPKLSALSRGDVWEVPFAAGNWSGKVRVRASVGESRYTETVDKFEFEYGTEHQSSVGITGDRLWQLSLGAQAKFKFGSNGDLTEALAHQHGWMSGRSTLDASRTIARAKTVEKAALFETTFNLTVEFLDAEHFGFSRPVAVAHQDPLELSGQVAVPVRETGSAPKVLDRHYDVPPQVAQHRRLAGTHIVSDVWVPGRPGEADTTTPETEHETEHETTGETSGVTTQESVPAEGAGQRRFEGFVQQFEAQAAEFFGGEWPGLRDRLLGEVDLVTLQQGLKGLMAGQEHSIELLGPPLASRGGLRQVAEDIKSRLPGQQRPTAAGVLNRPSSVITFKRATVARMRQVDNLPTTEFNIGTGTSRSQAKQSTDSDSVQVPFPGTGNYTMPKGSVGAGGGLRFGRDKVDLRGTGDDLALTSKLKSEAVVYEGEARLQLEFRQTSRAGNATSRQVQAGLGFRAVVDRAEVDQVEITTDPETNQRSQPPVFVAPEETERPEHETAPVDTETAPLAVAPGDIELTAVRQPGAPAATRHETAPTEQQTEPQTDARVEVQAATDLATAPPVVEYPAPPSEIWSEDAEVTGLPDTTTVRDLRDIAPLHDRLDETGRELLGERRWQEIRGEVLQTYSHSAVSAHLTAMTRKVPLRTPAVTAGALKDVHISLVAKVTELAHKRPQQAADLNTVREHSVFQSSRRLLSDTRSVQVQGGGKILLKQEETLKDANGKALKDTLQVTPTVSREVRDRDGWRDGESTKSYASGKFRSAQELYDSKVELELTFSYGDKSPVQRPIELEAEVGLEQKLTRSHPAGVHEQGANGVFTGPAERPAPEQTAHVDESAHVDEPQHGTQVDRSEQVERPAPPNAPKRLVNGRLDQSDVLVSLGGGQHRVLSTVTDTLARRLGKVPADLAGELSRRLDPFALTSELSRLSRGGEIRVRVNYGGWRGDVVVKASLRDFVHQESVPGFEFELGSQDRTTAGFTWDKLTRTRTKLTVKANVPHTTITGEYTRTEDSVHGQSVDRTGGTGSRGKSVEEAALFAGDTRFQIAFQPKRLSRSLARPVDVDVRTVVAVPHRDVVRDDRERAQELVAEASTTPAPPNLIGERGGRLGSSDIVTSVFALTPVPTGRRQVDAVLEQLDERGRKILGFDWPGVRTKLADALDLDGLHALIKPLTSGHEILVTHRGVKAWISADLAGLTHEGDAPQVEFNTGSSAQTSLTSSDGGTNTGGGHADAITLALLGTTDPLGLGLGLVAGGGVTGARGVDHLEQQSGSSSTGMAVKAKQAAGALDGRARLTIRFERSPLVKVSSPDKALPGWVRRWQADRGPGLLEPASPLAKALEGAKGAIVRVGYYQRAQVKADVGVKVLAEAGRYPRPAEHAPAAEQLAAHEEQPVPTPRRTVYAPPPGVFTHGLRDVDVLRWTKDSSGVRDLLRNFGPRAFGRGGWESIASLSRNTHSHAQHSARFGTEVTTPSSGRRRPFGDLSVKATFEVVQLEYTGENPKAELSPANESSSGGRRIRLDSSQWNGQVQLGLQADLRGGNEVTATANAALGRRLREGPSASTGGRVVANAKIPSAAVRYEGYAKVELTFSKDGKERVERGLVPIELEIPKKDTTATVVAADRHISFTPEDHGGIARTEAVVHAMTAGHGPADVHWPIEPLRGDESESTLASRRAVEEAIGHIPPDPTTFTIAYHSGAGTGAPSWVGRPLSTSEFADVLLELHDRGVWDGRPLRLLACEAGTSDTPRPDRGPQAPRTPGRPAEASYAAALLKEIHRRRPQMRLSVVAPAGQLWVIRPELVPDGRSHMVVGSRVGFSADGLPLVTSGGYWRIVTLPAGADAVLTVRDLPAHHGDQHPVGQADEQNPIIRPLTGATAFGPSHPPATGGWHGGPAVPPHLVDTWHDQDPLTPLSWADARAVFRQIADRQLTRPNETIPFDHPEDGCYNRANQMAAHLQHEGIATKKIWITHIGAGGTPRLWVRSDNAQAALPGRPGLVEWVYHVAVVVHVWDPTLGRTVEMVFDPSMHPEDPVHTETWLDSMGVKTDSTGARTWDRVGESFDEAARNLRLRYRNHPAGTSYGYPHNKAVVCTTELDIYFRPTLAPDGLPYAPVRLHEARAAADLRNYGREIDEHTAEAGTRRTLRGAIAVPGSNSHPVLFDHLNRELRPVSVTTTLYERHDNDPSRPAASTVALYDHGGEPQLGLSGSDGRPMAAAASGASTLTSFGHQQPSGAATLWSSAGQPFGPVARTTITIYDHNRRPLRTVTTALTLINERGERIPPAGFFATEVHKWPDASLPSHATAHVTHTGGVEVKPVASAVYRGDGALANLATMEVNEEPARRTMRPIVTTSSGSDQRDVSVIVNPHPVPVGGFQPPHSPAQAPDHSEDLYVPAGLSGTLHDIVADHTTSEWAQPVKRPVTPEQWQARRDLAPRVERRTERFQPDAKPFVDFPPTRLKGRMVYVRNAVRRIQADDGRWMRVISFDLPVKYGTGMSRDRLAGFEQRVRRALDRHLNVGHVLPRSGDQLHFEVNFSHDPAHPEAIELTGPPELTGTPVSNGSRPGRADQFHLDLRHGDAVVLHELLHYAGLTDEKQSATSLFRDTAAKSHRTGLMADVDSPVTRAVPHRHLAELESLSEDGTPLRDHPLTTGQEQPSPLPPGPRHGGDVPETRDMARAMARTHRQYGVHLLADPSMDAASRSAVEDAVRHIPVDPAYFTLAYHSTTTDGAPTWNGRTLTAAEFAETLLVLHGEQVWDGRPLRFVACETGKGGAKSFAADVLRELRKRRPDQAFDAQVPNGKVWVIRPEDPAAGDHQGRLVVSDNVGVDRNGVMRVVPGGYLLHLVLPAGEHEVRVAPPALHPDESHPPQPTAEFPITGPHEHATAFGNKKLLYDSDTHAEKAQAFEQRLGVYAYHHPRAQDAARATVRRLFEALKAAHSAHTPEQVHEVAKAFLKDDPASAGQVGTGLSLAAFEEMINTGSTRELMTALFNGAYFSDSRLNLKTVLKNLLQDHDEARAGETARSMGLNLAELRVQGDFLNGTPRQLVREALNAFAPGQAAMFAYDVFGTGNAIKQSPKWLKRGMTYVNSLRSRSGLPEGERSPDPATRTVQHYQGERMPLSAREIAYQEQRGVQVAGAPVVVHWLTGRDYYRPNEKSAWYRQAHDEKGMPVIAGISATTAKMLNAFQLLKVPGVEPGDMLLALMGWMLPLGDHSLYEILKGAQLLDMLPPMPPRALKDAALMYQHIPVLTQESIRTNAGENGMLPHEAAYHALVHADRRAGGFGEPGPAGRAEAEYLREVFRNPASGTVDERARVRRWVIENGMDADDVLERLTIAHSEALAVYTGPAYPLINTVIRFEGVARTTALRAQILAMVVDHGPGGLPPILRQHPDHGLLLTWPTAGMSPGALVLLRARQLRAVESMLPAIEREILVHRDMIDEALDKLPPVSAELWRGQRALGPMTEEASRLGSALSFRRTRVNQFESSSRQMDVALGFARPTTSSLFSHPLLKKIELTGAGGGRDIAPFSIYGGEAEVLVKPGTELNASPRTVGRVFGHQVEQVTMTEPAFESPFPHGTQEEQRLNRALAKLSSINELRTKDDLWPLAQVIGADHARPLTEHLGAGLEPAVHNAWQVAKLAADLHGGAHHLTLSGLTRMRRTADVVRDALKVPHEEELTRGHLERYVRELNGPTAPQVTEAHLHRLVRLVDDLKVHGRRVTPDQVVTAWRRVFWIGRHHSDPVEHANAMAALDRLPHADRYQTLAMHTQNGRVTMGGAVPLSARSLAQRILLLRVAKFWDDDKPLRFVACDLPVDYIEQVMQHLWAEGVTADAYVPDGTAVWFAPKRPALGVSAPAGAGHLIVSAKVGLTADGRPAVVEGGQWVKLSRPAEGHTGVLRQRVGVTLAPDALPAHFEHQPVATAIPEPMPGAVSFGAGRETVHSAIFGASEYPRHTSDFETRLGNWTAADPEVVQESRAALRRLGEATGAEGLTELVNGGSLHEVMEAFHTLAAGDPAHALAVDLPEPDADWHADLAGRGIRTVVGVSRAAAQAVHAYTLLGAGEHGRFAKALYGWLLPDGRHSLHEVVEGMRLAGAFPGAQHAYADGAELYRKLPGVPLSQLRPAQEAEVGDPAAQPPAHPAPEALTGGLPHERLYQEWVGTSQEVEEEVLTETLMRRETFAMTEPAPAPGVKAYQDWMARNGVQDVNEVLDGLSHPHFVALYTYTGPAYSLINVLLEHRGADPAQALRGKIAALLAKRYADPGQALPLSITKTPELAEGMAAGTNPWELANALSDERLAQIRSEMAMHSHMLADALRQLPPVTGTVYRGDATLEDPMKPTDRPAGPKYGGSRVRHWTFASFSTNRSTSVGFLKRYTGESEHRVLLELDAVGGLGRDVMPFSSHMQEEEVLFLPGVLMEITDRTPGETEDGVGYVLLKAREVPAEETDNTALPFRHRGAPDPDPTGPLAPAGGVRLVDGRTVADEQVHTRTITDASGRPSGRAVFHDADWALREGPYRQLSEFGSFQQRDGDRNADAPAQPVPWHPGHAYFYAGHADRTGFDLQLTDGSTAHGVSGSQVGGLLRRRPSVEALRTAAAQGKPASIVLLGCESAEHARAVAQQTGLTVHAPTGRTGVTRAGDGAQAPTLYVKPGPDGAGGGFRTFHPEHHEDAAGEEAAVPASHRLTADDILSVLSPGAATGGTEHPAEETDNSAVPPTQVPPPAGQLPPAHLLNPANWNGATGAQAARHFFDNGYTMPPQLFDAMPHDFRQRYADLEFFGPDEWREARDEAWRTGLWQMKGDVAELEEQRDSLVLYTGASETGEGDVAAQVSYFEIKAARRQLTLTPELDFDTLENGPRIAEHIGHIDDAISQCFVTEDLLVSRGAPYFGFGRHPRELRLNETVEEPTYVSVSVRSRLHGAFDKRLMRVHLRVPEGTRAVLLSELSQSPDELELLLPSGLRWTPTRIIPPLTPLDLPLDEGEETVLPQHQWTVYGVVEAPEAYDEDEFEDYEDYEDDE